MKNRKVKSYLLIHDIESLRNKEIKSFSDFKYSILHFLQNKTVLERVDGVIAHNDKMKSELEKMGINEGKIVSLEIFDYLIPQYEVKKTHEKDTILLAGNFDIKEQNTLDNYQNHQIFQFMVLTLKKRILLKTFTIMEHLLLMNCLIIYKVVLV